MSHDPKIDQLTDYLLGKELQQDDVGALSRFVDAHMPQLETTLDPAGHAVAADPTAAGYFRPTTLISPATRSTQHQRWSDIAALRTHAAWTGPNVTQQQITNALAAAGIEE